jgi:hypothetical protein
VKESIRPSKPIVFKAILPISAKNSQLGSLKEILKMTYEELHPLEHIHFDESEQPSAKVLV